MVPVSPLAARDRCEKQGKRRLPRSFSLFLSLSLPALCFRVPVLGSRREARGADEEVGATDRPRRSGGAQATGAEGADGWEGVSPRVRRAGAGASMLQPAPDFQQLQGVQQLRREQVLEQLQGVQEQQREPS